MFGNSKFRCFLLASLPFAVLSASLATIFLHESPQPWIFGRYSLPYFIFSLLTTVSIIFILFIYFRFKRKAFFIYGGLVVGFCSFIFFVEVAGQVYAALRPSYRVLSYVPEKTLGWKLAPNLEFVSTGGHWYAREFSVPIKINSLGFRDLDRKQEKPSGVYRIALMGDSFVEALQVPFSKTAGQILEKKLNEKFSNQTSGPSKFEVLNFGVGAHGTDQTYLTYLKYVKKTQPDYVFLFFFDAHIWRTWSNTYCSNFGSNENLCLKIRPFSEISAKVAEQIRIILQLEKFHRFISDLSFMKEARKRFPMIPSEYLNYISTHENLIDENMIQQLSKAVKEEPLAIHLPPEDYQNFISKQNLLIETEFNGTKIKVNNKKLFISSLISQFNADLLGIQKLNQFAEEELRKLTDIYKIKNPNQPLQGNENFPLFEVAIATTLKTIFEMAKTVQQDKAKLVVVDATKSLQRYGQLPAALLAKIIREFCKFNNIGYIPLHDPLNKSRKNGETIHWKYDHHFNETGNKIFSDSMFNYLKTTKMISK